jgi:ketopantoate hydroxymethyltransferase
MTDRVPKFCKKYANLAEDIPTALRSYHDEVKRRTFPEEGKNTYDMPEEEWRRFDELRQNFLGTIKV